MGYLDGFEVNHPYKWTGFRQNWKWSIMQQNVVFDVTVYSVQLITATLEAQPKISRGICNVNDGVEFQ